MADAGETSKAAAARAVETYGGDGERGGGGKLRRVRKPQSTPYDRPPSGRWISRIVDPAKRLFTGLLFSPSPSSNLADEVQREIGQEAEDAEENCSVDAVPRSSVGVVPSEVKGKSKLDISDGDGLDNRVGCSDDGAPDIEQLIKGKTFSSEEFDHLMKILRSRVVDVEQDTKSPRMTGPYEVKRAEISNERQKTPLDDEEELNRFQLATSTSLPQPAMPDGFGASPIDIARAYMGSRTSEMGPPSTSLVSKSENLEFTSAFSSKSVMASPFRKATICWPGAITQNQLDYSTLHSRNNRSGLHSFPRTPYSRTMYSKSKSKLTPLRGDSERFPSLSPAPFQPTATPIYGKVMNNVAEVSYGSGGPMRRMRNKFTSATPARESTLLSTMQKSPLARESNVDYTPKKTFEPGSSSNANFESVYSKTERSEAGVHSVHPHSSRLARQILERLDRPITLKEKSKELNLAASWKDSSPTSLATPAENFSSPSTAAVGLGKSKNVDGVNLFAQTNGESSVLPQERVNTFTGAGKDIIPQDKASSIPGANNGASSSLDELDSQCPEQGNGSNLPKTSLPFGDLSKGVAITNCSARIEPQNAHRKPILSSISIEKSGMRTSFASVTNPGFSFPVTTSSTTSAEPPTPSVMPSFLTSAPQQSKVSANLPTFTSGNKITIAPPVVAIPSPTMAFTPTDVSAPKFKFGSGKPRLSFSIAGDDAASSPNDSSPNHAAVPKFKFGSGKSRLNFGSIDSDTVCY